MRKRIKYSWEKFQRDSEELVLRVPQDKYNTIVGITRGGIFLAGMIAEITGIKNLQVIGLSGYKDTEKGKIRMINAPHQSLVGKKILLCDDISDSGETLTKAYKELSKLNQVVIVTLFCNPKTKFPPDYYLWPTEDWINFPWDYKN